MLPKPSAFGRARYNVGEVAGSAAIFPSRICLGVGAGPLFPPLDQALIHALACEVSKDASVSQRSHVNQRTGNRNSDCYTLRTVKRSDARRSTRLTGGESNGPVDVL